MKRHINRGSGVTFRLLLEALHAASSGSKVIYLVNHQEMAKHALDRAIRICTAYPLGNYYKVLKAEKKLVFENDGQIHFMGEQQKDNARGYYGGWPVIDDRATRVRPVFTY